MNLARDEVTKDRERRHGALTETLPAAGLEPEAAAVQRSDEDLVRDAVASLDPEQRMVLELSLHQQLSHSELATALGVTSARATVRSRRSRASFKSALLSLLVARSRNHCPGLAAMVPPGIQQLSPWLRRSADHHMRRCEVCRARAAFLSSPFELLGGIAFLPLPASLARPWEHRTPPTIPPARPAAARLRWGGWRSPAVVASGFATLLLFGGGIGGSYFLHNRHQPPTAARPARHASATTSPSDSLPAPSDTPIPPAPTPTPSPTDAPSPTPAQTWAEGQALLRSARGYHVAYGSYYVYPDGGVAGNPLKFDLQVQPNGDFQGTYTAIDGYIGQFDIRRVSGVLAVRHIDTAGNMGIQGAPPDALRFFNVTYDQANSLGDNWLPLTAQPQRAAANVLSAALSDHVNARTAASTILAPPPSATLQVEPGIDPGSIQLTSGKTTLTFRSSPSAFVDLSVSAYEVRFDNLVM